MSNIKKLYLNPRLKGSFSGAVAFYKNRRPNLPYRDVQSELLKLKEYYRFTPARKKFPRRQIVSHFANLMFCSDLIVLPKKYHKPNAPYKYILVLIDLFSRKMFAYGLKSKHPSSIVVALKKWLKQVDKKPAYLQTDRGKSNYLYISKSSTFESTVFFLRY